MEEKIYTLYEFNQKLKEFFDKQNKYFWIICKIDKWNIYSQRAYPHLVREDRN
jgi:hypothetical protein